MNTQIKIGHFQCECIPENYTANLNKIIQGLEYAQQEKVEIVSFPEGLLTGYFCNAPQAKKNALSLTSHEIQNTIAKTRLFDCTFMFGFTELENDNIYDSVLLASKGSILGRYQKAFPCSDYVTPGRNFEVFSHRGIKFGIIICADGGYIEPARILSLKGARIIFAPHYNYIAPEKLINHFQTVRSDHIARATENGIWFLRGNNFVSGFDKALGFPGVGYGDSYLLDPLGEIVVRSQRHQECFISATIDTAGYLDQWNTRSAASFNALLKQLQDAAKPPHA